MNLFFLIYDILRIIVILLTNCSLFENIGCVFKPSKMAWTLTKIICFYHIGIWAIMSTFIYIDINDL